jgi:hypothetical protein
MIPLACVTQKQRFLNHAIYTMHGNNVLRQIDANCRNLHDGRPLVQVVALKLPLWRIAHQE